MPSEPPSSGGCASKFHEHRGDNPIIRGQRYAVLPLSESMGLKSDM